MLQRDGATETSRIERAPTRLLVIAVACCAKGLKSWSHLKPPRPFVFDTVEIPAEDLLRLGGRVPPFDAIPPSKEFGFTVLCLIETEDFTSTVEVLH